MTPASPAKPAKLKKRRLATNASSILDDMTPMALFNAAANDEDDVSGTLGAGQVQTKANGFYEEQLILRLPTSLKRRFKESLDAGKLEQDFSLHFFDARNGHVTFQGDTFKAKVVDLPTITESYKTLDKKQFYKIADICQMVYVFAAREDEEDPIFTPHSNQSSYPHGLTPPLLYVTKRRFRKPAVKHQYGNSPEDVERIIAKLIEADMKAVSVITELVRPDELLARQSGEDIFHSTIEGDDVEFRGQSVPPQGEEDIDPLFEQHRPLQCKLEEEDSDDSDLAAEIEFSLLE